jgi:hypothetical protein
MDILLQPGVDFTYGPATVHVEALTEEGDEFVDAYTGPLVDVIDVGRIVIPSEAEVDFILAARRHRLKVGTPDG